MALTEAPAKLSLMPEKMGQYTIFVPGAQPATHLAIELRIWCRSSEGACTSC